MSVELIVYFRRSAMPSPSVWRQAILASGLPVELDDDFDPDTFSGFLPCNLDGKASGFEYFAGPLSPQEAVDAGAPAGSDFSVTLVTHSDLKEFSCAAIAAGALALSSGGLLIDPQSGESFQAADAMTWAVEQFAEAKR